jgi:ribosomal protein S27AE
MQERTVVKNRPILGFEKGRFNLERNRCRGCGQGMEGGLFADSGRVRLACGRY